MEGTREVLNPDALIKRLKKDVPDAVKAFRMEKGRVKVGVTFLEDDDEASMVSMSTSDLLEKPKEGNESVYQLWNLGRRKVVRLLVEMFPWKTDYQTRNCPRWDLQQRWTSKRMIMTNAAEVLEEKEHNEKNKNPTRDWRNTTC